MDKDRTEVKETIYELMLGVIDLENFPQKESDFVVNEFKEGMVCDKAYSRMYEANQRICKKMGTEENEDVEIIISSLQDITRCLCMKMFDYGEKIAIDAINKND